MLAELAVWNLGIIDELRLELGSGLTAVTGETGAGKTLVVSAIELLVGGRGDPTMVRPGEAEAVVEGLFTRSDGSEVVLRRVVPAQGRSRAYVDGALATAAMLAEIGAELVDLHGQHSHQSLLGPAAQRAALDTFAGTDLAALGATKGRLRELERRLSEWGGDPAGRARELDLLRYQAEELAGAALREGEDLALEREERELESAVESREAAVVAATALTGDEGAVAALGVATAALQGRERYGDLAGRLKLLSDELTELAREIRGRAEAVTEDPERLEQVRRRLSIIHDLRRKYGGGIGEILRTQQEVEQRLAELEAAAEDAEELEQERSRLLEEVERLCSEVAASRRDASPRLADQVQGYLRELALPDARFSVGVDGEGSADDVSFLFSANPGEPLLPLDKIASGGELARLMLAMRLVLTAGPETLVFDEVDAGIGGAAAVAVGRSLAALGSDHQVLVVTHLPQVAAYADHQIVVSKRARRGRTTASAQLLDGPDRVREISRMLAGAPESTAAQVHAEELLTGAAAERGR